MIQTMCVYEVTTTDILRPEQSTPDTLVQCTLGPLRYREGAHSLIDIDTHTHTHAIH